MHPSALLTRLLISLLFIASFASSQNLPQNLPRGSFQSPKTGVKWRYWIEDADVDPDTLRFDVSEMARLGSSGFELLSYQSYGDIEAARGDVVVDPADFAFGSDRFVTVSATLVQAAMENNITIDFSLGPDQGAGVPVFPDDVDMEGMNTEMVFGTHFIQPGDSFNGPLPSPIIVPFVDFRGNVASANITKMSLVGVIGAELASGANTSAARVSLDFNTVVDLTDQVQGSVDDGTASVSWTPSSNSTSVLLSYFSRRNGWPEAKPGFHGAQPDEPGSWGSWAVDHFSAKGANVSASFMQNNILSQQGIGDLLRQPGVGQYMWEDSMEFRAQLFWTEGLPQRFMERHGYNISIALPVLHTLRSFPFSNPVINRTFDYGTSFNWGKFTEDYQDTLTSLYIDYVTALSDFARSVGMTFSNQPGYNFRLDVAASAAIPDTPEIESLGVPTIDQARQLSGGVHLGNHTFFSSETGARPGEANALRMIELLEDAKTQYAGGVNVALLHGIPYSGDYPNTTWPGLTTFGYQFAEMHGPRQPAWNYYRGYLDFLARTQYLLQAGVAKVDLAIYRKDYDITSNFPFQGTSLISAGYTYEYISPENLKLPGVSVVDGRLAPAGPAYKALILSRVQNITVDAAQSLVDFSDNGFPIIFVGSVPDDVPGFETGDSQKTQVQNLMDQLVNKSTAAVVDTEDDVADALAQMGVLPAASADSKSPNLYTVVREVQGDSDSERTSHFYLFNSNVSTSGSVPGPINFTLTLNPGFNGTPFVLDPWTGEISPVALYAVDDNGTIVIPSVSLAPAQTVLFTVTTLTSFEGVAASSAHLTDAGEGVIAVASSTGVELRSFQDGDAELTLSNGSTQTVTLSLSGETPRELDGWQLNITAWTPPADLSQNKSQPTLVPMGPINLTQGLVPWDQLEGLANVSGVGTYVTTFEWDHTEDGGVGVQLDFGEVFHTIKAWINGVEIPTADPTNPVVDVSDFVMQGTNAIRVDAASTLLNVLNSVGSAVVTLNQPRNVPPPANQHYGLVAPVRLIPYARAVISF
ncbi:hypothetical protein D9758_006736 [Tetrapyrgos nigripes]|uniref:Uncharacterized protein n=1 Tax=Tetrapyrgos nigripes TaxID=182062 RepID=A0A8H5GJS7_9AGAR|nr:hypothetical protein D9758_006736 [Tetrapyrgos nigripes]